MASLNAFDDLLASYLTPFIQLSGQIGGLVQEQANLLLSAFNEQRKFIEMASQSSKPSNNQELMTLLMPISHLVSQIQVQKIS